MTAPVIYDVATDSFRPITQAEVDAMMRRLNALAPIDTAALLGQFTQRSPSPAGVGPHPWNADATRALR
jgi:hypothetical protein